MSQRQRSPHSILAISIVLQTLAIGLLVALLACDRQQPFTTVFYFFALGLGIIATLTAQRILLLQEQRFWTQMQQREQESQERKQITERLRQNQTSLAAAQRVAHIGSWEFDVVHQTGSWSDELFQIYGIDPSRPIPTYAELTEKIIHPDDRTRLEQQIKQSIATRTSFAIDLRILRPDGSIRYVESRGKPIFDPQGNSLRLIGTVLDITDRKQIEQELQRREAQLRALYKMVVTQGLTFEQRVQCFLELGCQCFGLDLGILSQIEENRYRIVAVHGSEELQPDASFDLSQTYCEVTIASATPVGFECARDSEWATHPCYQAFRLEAYLGVRIRVNGQLYGTLNFSSSEPRPRQFTASDRELIHLMAQWIGNTLERQQAKQALQQSEARYRAIVEDQTELICRYLPDSTILFVNDAFCRFFEKSKAELVGQSYEPVIFEPDRETVAQLVNSMCLENPVVTIENRVVVDGEVRWTQWINRMLFDAQGQFVEYQSVGRDITALKQAEHALRDSEERFRAIVENALDGILQTSPEGRILSANPALARIYGYDSPEALIRQMNNIEQQLYVDPKRRAEFIAYMHQYGSVSDFESQIYRQDGSIIWIAEDMRVVPDREGKLLYYEGTVRDVTDRKRMEEELRLERQKTEKLLLNILPQSIAERLKRGKGIIADDFAEVTVLFADLVDFCSLSTQVSPAQLVGLLNQIFSTFDHLVERYGLEKIKTIGDAYMAVGGIPHPRADHAEAIAKLALAMQQKINQLQRQVDYPFHLRIGIHTGPVIAGVIGTRKFSYDLWGDTVNIASRMESEGSADRIQVTATTYALLKDRYQFEPRGAIAIKGMGTFTTYWLTGRQHSPKHAVLPG